MIIFWLHSSSNTLSRYKLFSFCIIFLKIGTLRWRIMIMREPWLWIIILGLKQIKLYVKEIVSQLEIADVIFRRKRSNDRKYVCVSQAKWWSTLCSNKSKQLLKLSPFTLSFGSAQMLSEHLQTFPAMLGSLRKVIRSLQKSLRHLETPVMTKWQSQAFDSERVGRYTIAAMLMYRCWCPCISLLTFVFPFSLCRTETLNFLDWFWRWLIGVDHNRDSQKSRKPGVKFHELSCNSCWWHC